MTFEQYKNTLNEDIGEAKKKVLLLQVLRGRIYEENLVPSNESRSKKKNSHIKLVNHDSQITINNLEVNTANTCILIFH